MSKKTDIKVEQEVVYKEVPVFDSEEEKHEWAKKVTAKGNNILATGPVMMAACMYMIPPIDTEPFIFSRIKDKNVKKEN